jgi:replicative superfamily II helicase
MDWKKDNLNELKRKCAHLTIEEDEANFVFHKCMSTIIFNALEDLKDLDYHRTMMQWYKTNNKHTSNLIKMMLSDEQRREIKWFRENESKFQLMLKPFLS